ncbi:MAG: Hpt domain-containing protein, partial [Clostridiales bacterium]|nr:Hpt domain-containing protein [Clostridiales bacterium]
VQECYAAFGGDFDDAVGRLRSEERIRKFLTLFLKDTCISDLEGAMQNGNAEAAFRAAHTLKGICGNLSLRALSAAVAELTEALRGKTEIGQDAFPLFETAKAAYETTAQAIRLLP